MLIIIRPGFAPTDMRTFQRFKVPPEDFDIRGPHKRHLQLSIRVLAWEVPLGLSFFERRMLAP